MTQSRLWSYEWMNNVEVTTEETEREWECYQDFSISPSHWWDVHQCVWALITPRGIGCHPPSSRTGVGITDSSSISRLQRVNICCVSANRVCFYNQRWSALHHEGRDMLAEKKQTQKITLCIHPNSCVTAPTPRQIPMPQTWRISKTSNSRS